MSNDIIVQYQKQLAEYKKPICKFIKDREIQAVKEVASEIRAFLEEETEFIADVHADGLIDRLVKKLNEIEGKSEHEL